MPDIDLSQYYTADEAAAVLSKNSGRPISPAYVRQLVVYGQISRVKVKANLSAYPKSEIDNYKVEARGVRSAAAAKAKAKEKKTAATVAPDTQEASWWKKPDQIEEKA
jgi:hypothetical protein